MMSADVKASIKQQEIKDLVAHLTMFYKKYLQNLKYHVKRGCIFHLILLGIPYILILSVKNRGEVGDLLNGQNSLSVTKVICQQSLNSIYLSYELSLTHEGNVNH